ncbi:von Willebrand factor type A domain-containing protein [Chitinophagaceae bacterium LY-5]|uniref:von Willebrand factor type A domain-containing protein n=1 Tax=Polluticaenibacter yanchengensis TaxID=3014562 RepID=A0ABT4UQ20_9BACT|nr:von Willebrand factor type A domain-containing protein [Chitinophagaceae bacterium LY-5]
MQNKSGEGIWNAVISIVGTKEKVNTTATGGFKIKVREAGMLLRVEKSGYLTKEVEIGSEDFLKIVLDSITVEAPPVLKIDFNEADLNGTEPYEAIAKQSRNLKENDFKKVEDIPVSSFFVNVDGPTYANVVARSKKMQLPNAKHVQIEELVNAFSYDYDSLKFSGESPIGIYSELSTCPWKKGHQLLLVALRARTVVDAAYPPTHLVFLVDVSASMNDPQKLPLMKEALKHLTAQLREKDRLSMVCYANKAVLVLENVAGNEKDKIIKAIDGLVTLGNTAGSEGLNLAFETARRNVIKEGNNKVVLCTDGGFNLGVTDNAGIENIIKKYTDDALFLSVIGFGNAKSDNARLKRWAEAGNGFYNNIGGLNDANRLLINEYTGKNNLAAIDVRPLIRFNPLKVQAYRLIGFDLKTTPSGINTEEFGNMGSGHTVTAVYEIIPVGIKNNFTEDLSFKKYKKPDYDFSGLSGIGNIDVRYALPGNAKKVYQVLDTLAGNLVQMDKTTEDFKFVTGVTELGLLLRDSKYMSKANAKSAFKLIKSGAGMNPSRVAFADVAEDYKTLFKELK